MLKHGKKPLALLLATILLLCASPLTALAADIVFDGAGGAAWSNEETNNSTSMDGNGIITTSDANNSVTGDGSSYGLHFTNNTGTTTLTVVGDTTVGKGIEANGDLTITGDTSNGADTLTATGDNSPGIEVSGTLTIDGGVTVTANGQGTPQGYFDPSAGVMVGGDLNVNNGTLTATGAPSSGSGDTSRGIKADGVVYVNGVPVSLPAGNESTINGGKGTVTLPSVGTPGVGTPGNSSQQPRGLSFNKSTTFINAKTTQNLTLFYYGLTPPDEVILSSSSSAVSTVSPSTLSASDWTWNEEVGAWQAVVTVTGIKSGTITLTAAASDDSISVVIIRIK